MCRGIGRRDCVLGGGGGGDRPLSLLVGCFTSQQHASVSQGRICERQFFVLPH